MVFIGADLIKLKSFQSRYADLALCIELLRDAILFGVPEDINEFIRENHIKFVADLNVGEESAEICGLKSFIGGFVIEGCFVDFYD